MNKIWNLTFEHMKIVVLDGYGLNPGDLSWEELRAQIEKDKEYILKLK